MKSPVFERGLAHAWAVAPALLAALIVFHRATGVFFAADDLVALARTANLEPTPPTFRPLSAVLAFRIEHALFGLDPFGYHVVNLALHLTAVIGVYALAHALARRRGVAAVAALLFAISGIAFTPVHWVSGIGDLLACNLLLAATLVYRQGRQQDRTELLAAAVALACAAMLAKEVAIAWPLLVAYLEWRNRPAPERAPVLWPAGLAALAMGGWWAFTRPHDPGGGAYAATWTPGHLVPNLLTYLKWSVAIWDPHRDRLAAVDPDAWVIGTLVGVGALLAVRQARDAWPRTLECGLVWFLAFLLPVLPLVHHTYLYYLYVPWAGMTMAVAALGAQGLERLPVRVATAAALAALLAVTLVEGRGVDLRQRATIDNLPADRTLRESLLLGNVTTALRAAALPSGTEIGFVNPVGRPRFDLIRVAPTRALDFDERRSYLPLEQVLKDGRALRLFTPGLVSRGFAATIPPEWSNVECFLYEQRGYLRSWGRGPAALMRQGAWQDSLGEHAAAESSFTRARALPGNR